MKKYADVMNALEEREISAKMFEKAENMTLSGQTKLYSVRQVVPEEFGRDIIRSNLLPTHVSVRAYTLEPVAVRRHIRTHAAAGAFPMELDMVKKYLAVSPWRLGLVVPPMGLGASRRELSPEEWKVSCSLRR